MSKLIAVASIYFALSVNQARSEFTEAVVAPETEIEPAEDAFQNLIVLKSLSEKCGHPLNEETSGKLNAEIARTGRMLELSPEMVLEAINAAKSGLDEALCKKYSHVEEAAIKVIELSSQIR